MAFAIGLAAALFVGVLLLLGAGHDPATVYQRMFEASLGDPDAWSVTLNRAVPLGLAGLAVAIAGSMGLWNIGAEGQILAGAMMAAWVARVGDGWPGPIIIVAMLAAGAVGGGLLAAGPALARSSIGVNEIITTLMLNEVALRLVQWLIHGPWTPTRSTSRWPRCCPTKPAFRSCSVGPMLGSYWPVWSSPSSN